MRRVTRCKLILSSQKDLQSVVNMLRDNVNPNTQDNAGWTPLVSKDPPVHISAHIRVGLRQLFILDRMLCFYSTKLYWTIITR